MRFHIFFLSQSKPNKIPLHCSPLNIIDLNEHASISKSPSFSNLVIFAFYNVKSGTAKLLKKKNWKVLK